MKKADIPIQVVKDLKRDYVLGKGSIATLAETYGVNAGAMQKRAMTGKWVSIRTKYAKTDDVLILRDQIEDLNHKISECDEPKDIDSLYRAKQRALSMLWGITGHPKPPTAKPPKERNIAKEKMLKALTEDDRPKASKKVKRTVDQSVNQGDAPQDIVVESEPMDLSQYHIS